MTPALSTTTLLTLTAAMNAFFTNWYNALTPSIVQTQLISQPLITEIDPKKKTKMVLGDLLTALTAGLAFIAAPGAGAGISEVMATAGSVLLNGLKQAPGVAKAIWPSGTLDTQSIQLGNIDAELGNVFTNITNSVTAALTTVMSDTHSFIAFANDGAFSGSNSIPIKQDVDALTLGLKTYILSTAMSANGWHIGPITSVSRAAIASNTSPYGHKCTFGLDGGHSDICTTPDHGTNVYYSDATQRAYDLSYTASAPDLNPYTLFTDIAANRWSNLEVLFDNAFDCAVAGGTGKPLNFFEKGQLDFSCMSQLQMCACGNPCPVAEVNGKCPFHCDWLCKS